VTLNKGEKIFLIIGATAVASMFVFLAVDDWMLGFTVITGIFLFSILVVDPLDSRTKNENEIREKEEDEFGNEVMAAVDSRIHERPSSFIGLPIIIVFGGIESKYESVFSIKHEGKAVVILYHGICIVSAGDRLLIRGKWYRGGSLEYEKISLLRTELKT
jgi:hypothetical protein